MTEEIPVIPKVSNLVVHSGNIVNWNRLKRHPNHGATAEIAECIDASLKGFLETADKTALQYETNLECRCTKFIEPLPAEERGDLKVTVKVFLCKSLPPVTIKEGIEKVLAELNITFIETVLLALPELEEEEKDLSLSVIQPYWKLLEEMVEEEKVLSLGIADLDKEQLEELYNWAKIKPGINQVNLESCCFMPKHLQEYAKQNDIQLLSHNDARDVLPNQRLCDIIKNNTTKKDSDSWEMLWVMRYSVLIKCRGIIKTKAYITKCGRDTKRGK
ncbi:glutamate--cysteine ligase regulatory subunit-like [Ostrea edulis]|uniref:glutamate--cysteine ligase regulatory subunit-like n=1 Tax=Ostrea edulis TaxID=37623 RepID=UPI0024AFB84E|nr:glutamate--cysteine ligase regulatory subunit-like [Ostrea edulis]